MVKEIDVGASQMGIEILTNKGSKDNPTKSVEIQKPPETPYTIEDHSKMFEAMGQPKKANELKQKAIETHGFCKSLQLYFFSFNRVVEDDTSSKTTRKRKMRFLIGKSTIS